MTAPADPNPNNAIATQADEAEWQSSQANVVPVAPADPTTKDAQADKADEDEWKNSK